MPVCKNCGEFFKTRLASKVFCSEKCRNEFFPEKPCSVCGKLFKSNGLKHSMCSDACRRKHANALRLSKKPKREPRLCAFCGKKFMPVSTTQRLCSRDCKNGEAREIYNGVTHAQILARAESICPYERGALRADAMFCPVI